MSRRALRRSIARINQWTRRSRTHIERSDIRETRIRSKHRSSPCSRDQRRTSRKPVVAARAYTPRNPTHPRLQHNLVDRRAADAEEHVVVHLETLDALKDLDARTHLPLSEDERVVYKSITSVGMSGAVATDTGHASALRWDVLKHVSDNI